MIDSKVQHAADMVSKASTVFILAGAGLSSEVGIPTYWSDTGEALYGEAKSKQGYTALQHANATLWMQDTQAQVDYFSNRHSELSAINFPSSIYGDLLEALKEKEYFCVTSNTDSGFFCSGFNPERLFEVHGSYRVSQCLMDPAHGVFPTAEVAACPVCSMPTRPNALFFYDNHFNPETLYEQQDRFNKFVETVESQREGVVLLELGVGSTIPRVRQIGNRLYRDLKIADYIHVNLEPEPEFLFADSCSFGNREQWLQMRARDFIKAL